MAATVKKEGIRKRRFAQISSKHALSTPYNLQWPKIMHNGGNRLIIDQIVRTLEPLQFKQLGTRTPTALAGENEETAVRKLQEQERRAKKLEQRSALEIGLNQVMRALEKGSLRLVLVDGSIKPTTLLEHLLVLCVTRNTAACALNGMAESAIPMLLGVRRVAAFGFKLTGTPTLFDELVDFIKVRIPPLCVPWLCPSKEVSEQSAEENATLEAVNEADSEDENLPGIVEMCDKPGSKIVRESEKKAVELNTQPSVTRHLAVDTGRLTENSGIALENTENPVAISPTAIENTGQPAKEQLTREELLEVSNTSTSSPPFKQDSTMSKNEQKAKKRRRRRGKKNKGNEQRTEAPMEPVYLKPCIKSFDTTPKDKGDQSK